MYIRGGINYPDSTLDVEYTYDRLGRIKTVTDAAGSREYNCRANDFRLNSDLNGDAASLCDGECVYNTVGIETETLLVLIW